MREVVTDVFKVASQVEPFTVESTQLPQSNMLIGVIEHYIKLFHRSFALCLKSAVK